MRRAYAVSGHADMYGMEYSYLGIMGVLDGFVERGRGEVMLLPRDGHSAVERGCRSGPDVLVRFGEGGRLHVVGDCVDIDPTCQRVGGEVKVIVPVWSRCLRLPASAAADQLALGHQTCGERFMRPAMSDQPQPCFAALTLIPVPSYATR